MARIRFKAFGGYHTQVVEREVNKWLCRLEERGFYPEIIRKETRVTVSPRDGKAFVLVTFFYTLHPLDKDDPLLEVDLDQF